MFNGNKLNFTASNKQNIIDSLNKIKTVMITSVEKMLFTHFICIPIEDDNVLDKLEESEQDLIKFTGCDKKYIQARKTIHLTLTSLKILSDDEEKKCIELFDSIKEELKVIIGDKKEISFRGIDGFGEFNECRVVFAQPDVSLSNVPDVVQKLCETFKDYYPEHNQVFHVTLANTKGRDKINIVDFIECYGDVDYGKIESKSIQFRTIKRYGKPVLKLSEVIL